MTVRLLKFRTYHIRKGSKRFVESGFYEIDTERGNFPPKLTSDRWERDLSKETYATN